METRRNHLKSWPIIWRVLGAVWSGILKSTPISRLSQIPIKLLSLQADAFSQYPCTANRVQVPNHQSSISQVVKHWSDCQLRKGRLLDHRYSVRYERDEEDRQQCSYECVGQLYSDNDAQLLLHLGRSAMLRSPNRAHSSTVNKCANKPARDSIGAGENLLTSRARDRK